jgi:hypothetical protein
MFLETELELTESLANLGKSGFESVLREELRREFRTLLLSAEFGLREERHGEWRTYRSATNSEREGTDIDVVDVHIEKVEREKYFGKETLVSVHVIYDKIAPGENSEVTRSRCNRRTTVVLNPDADGSGEFKACIRDDTNEIYGDGEEELPAPPDEEESEWEENLTKLLRKFDASEFDPQQIVVLANLVQRMSKRPNGKRVQSLLAELGERLDALPRHKSNDA